MIDFALVSLAGIELWQFMFQTSSPGRVNSFMTRFKKLDPKLRSQRIWQTLLVCGPLLLSGASSVVKTYVRAS